MIDLADFDFVTDSLEDLSYLLYQVWKTVCDEYDVGVQRPPIGELFKGADLSDPDRAAQTVIMNMLMCMIECVDRFSRWYTKPARAYGLELVREQARGRAYWRLNEAAQQTWREELDVLSAAIADASTVLEAELLADEFIASTREGDECLLASCSCPSPRLIRIWRSAFEQKEVVCESCRQPFRALHRDL